MDWDKPHVEYKTKAGEDLDKFKRRLIRAVARLLLIEKLPENELWSTLKKETGCDCQVLCMRMRALTMKKLNRLFAANDIVKDIPKVARMTVTDWLLFDMVLVHQNVDVIGQENGIKNAKDDPKPLVDLFKLVMKYKIAYRTGESLAEAWSAATLEYNSQGHQCSPMLLQLRWYQLRKLTRDKFYNFWFAYRGTVKRLSLAEPHMPTLLQAAIAKEFKGLVIKPFLEWDEMIQKRMVTIPEEFEKKMVEASVLKKHAEKRKDDGPDLVIVEPNIETIDLRVESDDENNITGLAEIPEKLPEMEIKIKEEPLEMDIDIEETRIEEAPKKTMYEVVLESTAMEQENIDSIDSMEETEQALLHDELGVNEDVIEQTAGSPLKDQEPVMPQITNVFGNVTDTSALDDSNALKNVVENSVVANVNATPIIVSVNDTPVPVELDDTTVLETADATSVVAKEDDTPIPASVDGVSVINEDAINVNSDVGDNNTNVLNPDDIQMINTVTDAGSNKNRNTVENREQEEENVGETSGFDGPENDAMDIDGQSFKASNVNEDAAVFKHNVDDNVDADVDRCKINDVKPDVPKFMFGELSNDMDFVDDGIMLIDDGIAYHDEDKNTEIEVRTEVNDEEDNYVSKIDPKIIMCPIVYTTKLDDMGLPQPFAHIKGNQLLNDITLKSKPVKIVADDNANDDSEDEVENEVTESQRVTLTSYFLQKPRSRKYNPIQLCKNPDFNTRLKRLTVGFFSSLRNRVLIKSCKPLTIDLSKAFESKLISGTLYLKASDHDAKPEVIDDTESRQSVSVVPSAMPAQSLIDNSKIGDILPLLRSSREAPKPLDDVGSISERSKVINLPDISEIRRINQRLLTAEVTPIQIKNNIPQVPVTIVTSTPVEKSMEVVQSKIQSSPEIVDVTLDLPSKNNTENNLLTKTNSLLRVLETQESTNTHFQENTAFSTARNVRPGRKKFGPAIAWKPRQLRPAIPWFSKNQDSGFTCKVEETLLTLDTLNKMLCLLTNENEDVVPPKPKQTRKRRGRPFQKEHTGKPNSDSNEIEIISETQDNQNEPNTKCGKPKINIKSAMSYREKIKATRSKILGLTEVPLEDTESETENSEDTEKSKDESTNKAKKEVKYCCWSRQRMLQMLFSRKRILAHQCPYSACTCCCRTLLEQYLVNDRKLKKAQMQDESSALPNKEQQKQTPTNTNIADDNSENNAASAKTSDETAKQVNAEEIVQVVGSDQSTNKTPVLDVEALQDRLPTNVIEKESIDIDALTPQNDIPNLGEEVTVIADSSVPQIPVKPKIIISHKRKPYVSQNPVLQENVTDKACPTPTLRNFLSVNTLPAFKTQVPNVSPLNAAKPFKPPKNLKEKMIFLNSKQISENPAENPIFLGKSKILLTTVKFPPNLRRFEEVKQALKSTLNIPNGVQLICLPNGTVAYTIDPHVEVDATSIALMPAIIASIQAEINKPNPVTQSPKSDAVVNLVDDDDDVPPNDDNVINEETASVAEVPRTEVDVTESTINSSRDSTVIETEHNIDESICSKQNPVSNNNQEDTQDLIHIETPSKSVENNQPALTSTEVDKLSTSEPCKINKSKNILSDLMQMSGISVEDVTPRPEEAVPIEANEQGVAAVDAPTTDSAKSSPVMIYSPKAVRRSYQNNVPPVIKSPVGELSPITSLYELKYACLNNGIFFKLDFDTGYLVPINVCMKQRLKPVPKVIDPKSVIDLTADENDKEEFAPTFSVSNKSPNQRSLLIVNNVTSESLNLDSNSDQIPPTPVSHSTSPVKPIKLFRAAKPFILEKRQSQTNPLDNTSNNVTINHTLKRKQIIKNVDLDEINDSHTAMAKQPTPKLYFRKVKSKVIHTTTPNEAETTSLDRPEKEPNIESDDSSDEEPLSNLAKRKRANEAQAINLNETHPDNENEPIPDIQTVEMEPQAAYSEDVYMNDNEPTESETHYEIILDQDTAEEDEEHCILGV